MQIDHRFAGFVFHPDEDRSHHHPYSEKNIDERIIEPLDLHKGKRQQVRSNTYEKCTCPIKIERLVALRPACGHKAQHHKKAYDSNRKIHEEEPVPGQVLQDDPAQGWPGDDADRNQQADDAQSLAAFLVRESFSDYGGAQRHVHGSPHCLNDPRGDQPVNIGAQSA